MNKNHNLSRETKQVSFNKQREADLKEFADSIEFSIMVKKLLLESKEFKEFQSMRTCSGASQILTIEFEKK